MPLVENVLDHSGRPPRYSPLCRILAASPEIEDGIGARTQRVEIAFGILSSWESEESVRQLIRSLGNEDPVFVHQDLSKRPTFSLAGTDAYLIPDYVETSWGSADLARAILHLIKTALQHSRFDYFQLLSASCLPLQRIEELRRHLDAGRQAIFADLLNLDTDERVMMSHGHRVFCRAEKMTSRLLSRSRRWYFGDNPVTRQQANLGVDDRQDSDAPLTALQWMGKQVHQAARAGMLDSHPFNEDLAPMVGSLWFCLRRDVCEYLVQKDESDPVMAYLMGLKVCDEVLFPTLLGNSGFDVEPSNHLVNDFIGSHPRFFDERDLQRLACSQKFFARKFKNDADEPVRRSVLQRLGR
jgi:hypothetical protein